MLSPPVRLLIFCLFLGCFTVLQGCASAGKDKSAMKIGMHIDAVLEFAVEYPLSWSKDRRLAYGAREGEVRWTPPDRPETILRIKSFQQKQPALGTVEQVEKALRDDIGLEIRSKEKIILPAGEAWYMTGQTGQRDIIVYLFLRAERSYLIALTVPPDQRESCEEIMDRVTRSFQITPL